MFEDSVFYVYSVHVAASGCISTAIARTRAEEKSAKRLRCHTELDYKWHQKTPADPSEAVEGRTVCSDVCCSLLVCILTCQLIRSIGLSVSQSINQSIKITLVAGLLQG